MPVISVALNGQVISCVCGNCEACDIQQAEVDRQSAIETVVVDGITCVVVHLEDVEEWARQHVLEGYAYGCKCGESYSTARGAHSCRKCRSYLSDEDNDGTVYFTPEVKEVAHV